VSPRDLRLGALFQRLRAYPKIAHYADEIRTASRDELLTLVKHDLAMDLKATADFLRAPS